MNDFHLCVQPCLQKTHFTHMHTGMTYSQTPTFNLPSYSLMVYMTILHKAASVHCHKFLRAVKFGRYRSTSRKEKTKV